MGKWHFKHQAGQEYKNSGRKQKKNSQLLNFFAQQRARQTHSNLAKSATYSRPATHAAPDYAQYLAEYLALLATVEAIPPAAPSSLSSSSSYSHPLVVLALLLLMLHSPTVAEQQKSASHQALDGYIKRIGENLNWNERDIELMQEIYQTESNQLGSRDALLSQLYGPKSLKHYYNTQAELNQLLYQTILHGDHDVLTLLLLNEGAEINTREPFPFVTPLYTAVMKNRRLIIKRLLEEGADPNVQDDYGLTPLHRAATTGYFEAVRDLRIAGAEVDRRAKGRYGVTPLYLAAENNHFEISELLLKQGADPNMRCDPHGYTPLHAAAWNGHLSLIQLLLAKGSDVNRVTFWEDTALHLAALRGHRSIVASLIEAGADIHARRPKDDTTPLKLATQEGHKEIIELLTTAAEQEGRKNQLQAISESGTFNLFNLVVTILFMGAGLFLLVAQKFIINTEDKVRLLTEQLNKITEGLGLSWSNLDGFKCKLSLPAEDLIYPVGALLSNKEKHALCHTLEQIKITPDELKRNLQRSLVKLGLQPIVHGPTLIVQLSRSFSLSPSQAEAAGSELKRNIVKTSVVYQKYRQQQALHAQQLQVRQERAELTSQHAKLLIKLAELEDELALQQQQDAEQLREFEQVAHRAQQVLDNSPTLQRGTLKFATELSKWPDTKIKELAAAKEELTAATLALERALQRLQENLAFLELHALQEQLSAASAHYEATRQCLAAYRKQRTVVWQDFVEKRSKLKIALEKGQKMAQSRLPPARVAAVVVPPVAKNLANEMMLVAANPVNEVVPVATEKEPVRPRVPPAPQPACDNQKTPEKQSLSHLEVVINDPAALNMQRFFGADSKQRKPLVPTEMAGPSKAGGAKKKSYHSILPADEIGSKVVEYAHEISGLIKNIRQYDFELPGENNIFHYALTYNIARMLVALWELDYQLKQVAGEEAEQQKRQVSLWRHMMAHLPNKARTEALISFALVLREQFLAKLLKAGIRKQRAPHEILVLFEKSGFIKSDLYQELHFHWEQKKAEYAEKQPQEYEPVECLQGIVNALDTLRLVFKVFSYQGQLTEQPDRRDALKMLIVTMQDYYLTLQEHYPEVCQQLQRVCRSLAQCLQDRSLRNSVFHKLGVDIDNEKLWALSARLYGRGVRLEQDQLEELLKELRSNSTPAPALKT